jgi:tetratricopeptide (TPR) repeat protein
MLLFTLSGVLCHAQSTLPDSVEQRFANIPRDSNYVTQLNALATFYLKTNPTLSRRIASYTAEFAPRIPFPRGYARALTVIGNSYWYEGIYEFAQNYYLLAARQYRNIHDSVGLGQVYNNIGEVNKRLGEYEKALDYLLLSMKIKKNDSTKAITLYNIGELYIATRRFDEAMKYLNESLSLALRENDERVIAYDYWSIARIRSKEGKFREALSYFKQAEEIWTRLGETRSLIQTYQDLAEMYRQHDQLNTAQLYLERASHLATKINVPDLRITTYLGFSKIDSARGNYSRALYHLFRHNALKDSVYNLLKAEQIARVQAIYETELREHENQQLRAEKELQDQQLRSREGLLAAISIGLLIAGALVWVLSRQRKKLREKNLEIHDQKEAIEVQAAALLKLNEALQELNKNLENRIEERSRQLFIQNQRLAEYTFINAHKLRAPVASILGLINLIHQVAPQERDAVLNHLKTCGDQLDSIIREISRDLEAAMVHDPGSEH